MVFAVDYQPKVEALSLEDGGGFIAFYPDLLGCKSDGETKDEAIANLKDAFYEWVEEYRRLGRCIPDPFYEPYLPMRGGVSKSREYRAEPQFAFAA